MRDFFINLLEGLIGVIVILGAIAVVIMAISVTLNPGDAYGGLLSGLIVLIFGGLYLIFVGGFLYLGLGIYQNTKRTAEAVEKLAIR